MPNDAAAARLFRNRAARLASFVVGLLLFYGPFALALRVIEWLAPASPVGRTVSDVHTACMRMPIGWLAQPWMWPTIGSNALYLIPLVVLPLAAVLVSPLFCGWLCPAGAFPEFLGRAVPERFKYDLKGRVPLVPLRYGFLFGLLIAPFVTANICCAYCNFTQMQNLVSAATGDPGQLLFVGTTGVITMALWLVVLGVFVKGGRGWCMLMCPAGALMSLASGVTSRLGFLGRVRHDASACTSCGACQELCPVRAIDGAETGALRIEQYLCNGCVDCVRACPGDALRFGTSR